ncbi:MAG TPA: SIS domain-containing protein [Alphaproteobacteria bacterium]|nr:SIS domain-containing protein [Alphaproteobacteria bacterium]
MLWNLVLENEFNKYIDECSINLKDLKLNIFPQLEEAIININKCFSLGGKIIFFGNGGSASDSQHICAEFVGRYKKDRAPLAAIALNTDTSILTSVANDMGYEQVFERQVQALAKKEDILFAISTSGESKNVINAVKIGTDMGLFSISLTGMKESTLSKLSNISINVPSNKVNHIQEMHIIIGHFICEMAEKHF